MSLIYVSNALGVVGLMCARELTPSEAGVTLGELWDMFPGM